MTDAADTMQYRKLRAPSQSGKALVDPAWNEAAASLPRNRQQIASCAYRFLAHDWQSLASFARNQLLAAAVQHSATYLPNTPPFDAIPSDSRQWPRIILTGHQPQLYHPGVWFKNFALSKLAAKTDAVAINLLIDNDTLRSATIRVPSGSIDSPSIEHLPFDAPAAEMPFEERTILDATTWRNFGERVTSVIAPFVKQPLIADWWPSVVEASKRTANIGAAISAARHQLESRIGFRSLDVPLSAVCDALPFRIFFLALCRDAKRFGEVYNQALGEYRRVHHLRGQSHPVPNLSLADEFETPFWIWTKKNPKRRRLFVRPTGQDLELSDHEQWSLRLRFSAEGSADEALSTLEAARRDGVKIRPRALATTLFARLLLSDLFLHGIGGAKYDQVTDLILHRFFGVEPPVFATITATLTLPIAQERTTNEDVLRLSQSLREMRFHPERFFDGPPHESAAKLIAEKLRWLRSPSSTEQLRERHIAISQINAALQPLLESIRNSTELKLRSTIAAAQRYSLLASREFSFCLFPEEKMVRLLLELCERQT